MPPREVAHRVGEGVRRRAARGRLEGWDRYHVAAGAAPRLAGLRERAVDGCCQSVREAVAAASRSVLDGNFSALGVDWPTQSPPDLFPPAIWRLDPVTRALWPGADRYCFDVRYRHERLLGDVKYVWEFNRLQFLQPLAAHAALTGDRASLAAIEQAVASWFKANPPFRGLAWVSGIELALRSISLLVTATLCGDALSSETVERIRTMLNAHAFWLERYPSRFSSANNHLVAEAAGLFLIGMGMQDLPGAAALEARARSILEEEAAKQILADGVPSEQSPTYGAFTAEFLLLSSTVAAREGRPLSDGVRDRLLAFATFVGWLADAKGGVPGIGDDDEGRVVTTASHEAHYAASVASCIAAPPAGSDTGPEPVEKDLRAALFGAARRPAAPDDGLMTFPEGGYTVVRETRADRSTILVFDHGPLGYLSIAAHGHADALAFTLNVDDRPILVDAGTYLYHAGGAWRDWFRGTRSHNTLAIGDADQSVISGPFNWSHKAQARLDQRELGPDWRLRASHDGYLARFGVRHERTIAAAPGGYDIVDRLIGTLRGGRPTVAFLVAPECDVAPCERGILVSVEGRSILEIGTTAGGLTVERGAERYGWVSPRFGHKIPSSVVRWQGVIPPDGLGFSLVLR